MVGSIELLFNNIETNFPFYLEVSNLLLCFVFKEVILYTDKDVLKQGQNKDKDEQWACSAIKTVRVLLPSPYSKPQIYFEKMERESMDIHQSIFQDLLKREHFPLHIFIWNNDNYSNNFMQVVNKFPDNSIILPDPERLRQCAFDNITKHCAGTPKMDATGDYIYKFITTGREKLATNIGVTTEMANKRGWDKEDGSTNHHSKPPMAATTKEYSDVLRSCSLVASLSSLRPS